MQMNSTPTADDVAHVLSFIPSRPSYPDWVEVISAVGNALAEDQAETVLLQWSPDERPGETRAKLRHRLHKITFASLVHRAQQNGFDAKAWHRERAQAGYLPIRRTQTPPATPPPPPAPIVLKKMPAADAAIYDAGLAYLRTNPAACAEIDTWRGYRPGTTAALAESGAVACPLIHGKRCHAFVVQAPDGCEVGFHARHPAPVGERARWSYHPTGTPGLPFVLGGGCAPHATRVIVTEGQWDAIAVASAVGWLVTDSSWDTHVVLLGSRGAQGVKPILEHWKPRIHPRAAWHLFRDDDTAGESWHKFAAQLRSAGCAVHLRKPAAGKDVNDVLRGITCNLSDLLR